VSGTRASRQEERSIVLRATTASSVTARHASDTLARSRARSLAPRAQFPHFFALAYFNRKDYARGGFAMVPVRDPTGARTAALVWRYSLYLVRLVASRFARCFCSKPVTRFCSFYRPPGG